MEFLSTLSLRRATPHASRPRPVVDISIHALLAESDGGFDALPKINTFISIHALLAESDLTSVVSSVGTIGISIHALLAESDSSKIRSSSITTYFYPRSPCGERLISKTNRSTTIPFLSTLTLRRATRGGHVIKTRAKNFYPRSPCGERLLTLTVRNVPIEFLSTLSLRRATTAPRMPSAGPMNFYPRSPCGERPGTHAQWPTQQEISIHALLAESDVVHIAEHASPGGISIHALLAESD